jgi:hypothetical protein
VKIQKTIAKILEIFAKLSKSQNEKEKKLYTNQ